MFDLFQLASNQTAIYELQTLRIGSDKSLVIPFTTDIELVHAHYVAYPDLTGWIRCNQDIEDTCTLCRVGKKRQQRYLLPVYDPITDSVAVLAMSDSRSPGSLLTQITEALKGVDFESSPPLLEIHKPTAMAFSVTSRALGEKAMKGAEAIALFTEEQNKNEKLLASTIRVVTNEELNAIPEIQSHLELLGG